jgi:GrpB-like predicted nucleotidyltransferase (UPF0157 family)
MNPAIEVVEADPDWPVVFEQACGGILGVIGAHVMAIEHIGSTAVPGLAAKPTIDIMAGLRALADAAHCFAPLGTLGYEYVPKLDAVMPERRFFKRDVAGRRTHHLHMVEVASDFWRTHLLFRDWLRGHSEDASCYAALKRGLAARFPDDREAYTEGKSEFIRGVLRRAEGDR